MSEVGQPQANLETDHAKGCTKAVDPRPVPDQCTSTIRAQFASSEHNQSTIQGGLPVDLQLVVGAWERLPDVVRAAIVGMVKGAVKGR